MNNLISICIPTYQRPELLQKTIASCLKQSYREIEIIISDDSEDHVTQQFVEQLSVDRPIIYHRNSRSLGQAGNVNQLFDLAHGDRLVLIHDDDLLLPNAVTDLAQCWDAEPTLTTCYGKQYVIDIQDKILSTVSDETNSIYHRTSDYAGYQPSEAWSALTAQFPNNGYMVRTEAARAVRYRSEPEVGDACDYDFGLRLALAYKGFYFLDTFVSAYRLTPGAIREAKSTADAVFHIIRTLPLPAELGKARRARLGQYASPAVSRYLMLGQSRKALRVFISQYYPFWHRFTLKGIAQAILILCPNSLRQRLMQSRYTSAISYKTQD